MGWLNVAARTISYVGDVTTGDNMLSTLQHESHVMSCDTASVVH